MNFIKEVAAAALASIDSVDIGVLAVSVKAMSMLLLTLNAPIAH